MNKYSILFFLFILSLQLSYSQYNYVDQSLIYIELGITEVHITEVFPDSDKELIYIKLNALGNEEYYIKKKENQKFPLFEHKYQYQGKYLEEEVSYFEEDSFTTRYIYNEQHKLIKKISFSAKSQDTIRYTVSYPNGNTTIEVKRDAEGNLWEEKIEITYPKLGVLKQKTHLSYFLWLPYENEKVRHLIKQKYNTKGRIKSEVEKKLLGNKMDILEKKKFKYQDDFLTRILLTNYGRKGFSVGKFKNEFHCEYFKNGLLKKIIQYLGNEIVGETNFTYKQKQT